MRAILRLHAHSATAVVLAAPFFVHAGLVARGHVVSPAELQKEVVAASEARQRDLETVQQFLSTPTAEKAMKSAQLDPRQIKTAVSTLSDQELAQLAARADKAQADFAAGRISDRDLILIILAILALVLIIVAVR
jgi:hypothetical protein